MNPRRRQVKIFFVIAKKNSVELVFATNNKHKVEEVRKILPATIHLLTLADIGCNDEAGTDSDAHAAAVADVQIVERLIDLEPIGPDSASVDETAQRDE